MKVPLDKLVAGLIPAGVDLPATPITGIATHAERVRPGDLFVAIPGTRVDGHEFIPAAIRNGAVAIITNGRDLGTPPVPQIRVANPRRAASVVAAEFYHHPSRQMTLIGITGTNGKTTTASLTAAILKAAGHPTAQMGTLGLIAEGFPQEKSLTTPDPIELHRTLYHLHRRGFTHVVMEVSSHALHQFRVADVDFNIAVFTNLTPEHLDYHGTMEEYYHAKARLFKTLPITATAVVNIDDPYGVKIRAESTVPVVTTALKDEGDVHYLTVKTSLEGIHGHIQAGEHRYRVASPLIGGFNRENILAAVAAAHVLRVPVEAIEAGLRNCTVVPGRMEVLTAPNQGKIVVDYAHTPDAYQKVLATIKEILPEGGTMTVVFGAGGDRDRTKRPVMAQLVETYADRCFVTPDNPRFEDLDTINADLLQGFSRPCYTLFDDRGEALQQALQELGPRDVLVVLGKGRETYQDVRGEKIYYSDIAIIEDFCRAN
jgi:UDP-N-acetylmuramoyl-L-alanyl-D-glutamate--2,6-diaminopimelate ligase